MADSSTPGPLLSVRAAASVTVEPDSVTFACMLRLSGASRAGALMAVAVELTDLTADLTRLGGTALTRATARAPLTWSAQSAGTHVERAFDKEGQTSVPTGLVTATVAVLVTVRSFDLIENLGRVFAGHEPVEVQSTSWEVDADNPAWATVRADAIHAAIAKGHDYAAALGSSIDRVEHIADSGLLGGGNDRHSGPVPLARKLSGSRSAGSPDTPSLDPVPQDLMATIEARFVATPVTLTKN
jgi:uncharacterized protein YggE